MVWSIVCGVVIGGQMFAHGQQAAFEAASAKPNRSGDAAIRIDMPGPDRFAATNVPLRELIRFAYDVQDARLVGGPDWIRSERFDVAAKAPHPLPAWGPAGPAPELLQMLRTLLAERFALAVHQEMRDLPVYAMVMARRDRAPGPELHASTLDCDAQSRPCGMRIGPGQMVMSGTPMSQFAGILPPFVQRIVIDRTGLDGRFDFHLQWTPVQRLPPGPPPPGAPPLPPVDPNGPSIFTALEEQLGLRLEPQRAPLDVVVIDRVERPAAD
jgi:uncharacterized protein (TIGR03435 family)